MPRQQSARPLTRISEDLFFRVSPNTLTLILVGAGHGVLRRARGRSTGSRTVQSLSREPEGRLRPLLDDDWPAGLPMAGIRYTLNEGRDERELDVHFRDRQRNLHLLQFHLSIPVVEGRTPFAPLPPATLQGQVRGYTSCSTVPFFHFIQHFE